MITKAPEPYVLLDRAPDDLCETYGWVETSVSIDEARDLLARHCQDENGVEGHRPAGAPGKQWFAPTSDPARDYAGWVEADKYTPGAREFWQLSAGDVDLGEHAPKDAR